MVRILVVDDDLNVLLVTRVILERSGFTTLSAANGPEALSLLHAHRINVLLTDIMMPGMSGGELIEEARRRYPRLRVCCMTSYVPFMNHPALKRVLILSKPFKSTELINALHQVLKARPQRRRQMDTPSSVRLSRRNRALERQTLKAHG
jgi:CheY-like chemotaxis protein